MTNSPKHSSQNTSPNPPKHTPNPPKHPPNPPKYLQALKPANPKYLLKTSQKKQNAFKSSSAASAAPRAASGSASGRPAWRRAAPRCPAPRGAWRGASCRQPEAALSKRRGEETALSSGVNISNLILYSL